MLCLVRITLIRRAAISAAVMKVNILMMSWRFSQTDSFMPSFASVVDATLRAYAPRYMPERAMSIFEARAFARVALAAAGTPASHRLAVASP